MLIINIFLMINAVLIQKYLFLLCCLLFLLIALNRFILPKRAVKKQYALILKSLNETKWINKITFSDDILIENKNSTSRYAYTDIVKVSEDPVYFHLFYNEDMVIRILKGSFMIGNDASFREFCNTAMGCQDSTKKCGGS